MFVAPRGWARPPTRCVVIMGPEKVAELVAEAGLIGWLIDKVS